MVSQLAYTQFSPRLGQNQSSTLCAATKNNIDSWRASISVNGKRIHLGQNQDMEYVIKLRKDAEENIMANTEENKKNHLYGASDNIAWNVAAAQLIK